MSNVQFFSSLAVLTLLVGVLLQLLRESTRRGDDVRLRLDGISAGFDPLREAVVGVAMGLAEVRGQIADRFTAVDAALVRHDARFDGMQGQIGQVDGRCVGIEARLDGVDVELRSQRREWTELFRGVYVRLDALEAARA